MMRISIILVKYLNNILVIVIIEYDLQYRVYTL